MGRLFMMFSLPVIFPVTVPLIKNRPILSGVACKQVLHKPENSSPSLLHKKQRIPFN
jgi:hypothetical protein